jgi:hypothetical protein
MRDEFDELNEGIVIPTHIRSLVNPHTLRERRKNREISMSSVVFVVKARRLAQSVIKKDITAVGTWYGAKVFPNAGPDIWWELCCGWGHIENKCGNMPKCGYCSGTQRTSNHRCNEVGFMSKQASFCCHTLEKCPNCKGNHIAFSSRCAKKSKDAKAAWHSRKTGTTGQAPTCKDMHTATGTNSVVLGRRPWGVAAAEWRSEEEEIADVLEEETAG